MRIVPILISILFQEGASQCEETLRVQVIQYVTPTPKISSPADLPQSISIISPPATKIFTKSIEMSSRNITLNRNITVTRMITSLSTVNKTIYLTKTRTFTTTSIPIISSLHYYQTTPQRTRTIIPTSMLTSTAISSLQYYVTTPPTIMTVTIPQFPYSESESTLSPTTTPTPSVEIIQIRESTSTDYASIIQQLKSISFESISQTPTVPYSEIYEVRSQTNIVPSIRISKRKSPTFRQSTITTTSNFQATPSSYPTTLINRRRKCKCSGRKTTTAVLTIPIISEKTVTKIIRQKPTVPPPVIINEFKSILASTPTTLSCDTSKLCVRVCPDTNLNDGGFDILPPHNCCSGGQLSRNSTNLQIK